MSKYSKYYKKIKIPFEVGQDVYCIQCDKDSDGYFTGTKSVVKVYITRIDISGKYVPSMYDIEFYISKKINTSCGYITTDKFDESVIGSIIFHRKEDAEHYLRNHGGRFE